MTMSKVKRIVLGLFTIFAVIFLIPIVLTIVSEVRYELTKPPPLLRETADTTPVHVVIGEHELWIPANYFQFGYDERDKKEHVFAIRTYWPDMMGATEETIKRRRTSLGHLNEISMVVHGGPSKIDPIEGRKRHYNSLITSKYDKFKSPKEIYGLIYHENISDNKMVPFRDVYLDKEEPPQALITCISNNIYKKKPYPSCRHTFRYKRLYFIMNYSREYLPQWKEIQKKVETLIDQFEKKPNSFPLSSASGE